jgi:hypothetical protein
MQRKEIKKYIEELIWLIEYSNPTTDEDVVKEEKRILEIEQIMISTLKINFAKYRGKKEGENFAASR